MDAYEKKWRWYKLYIKKINRILKEGDLSIIEKIKQNPASLWQSLRCRN